MLDCWSCDAQSLRSSTSISECQTRLEREGEIWTLECLTLAIQSIVLIPVQGFGMLGEDVEEDLSHILSANV